MIKKITIYILAGLVFMLPLIVTASEIPAHEIVYEEKEEGTDVYTVKYTVSDKLIRIDDSEESDEDQNGFIIFDLKKETIYSISHFDKTILIIPKYSYTKKEKTEEAKIKPIITYKKLDDAPTITGKVVFNYKSMVATDAGMEVCMDIQLAENLLPSVIAKLKQYQTVVSSQQVKTINMTPEEYRTPCYLLDQVYNRGDYYDKGLPLHEWHSNNRVRILKSFDGVSVNKDIFLLPMHYKRFTLDELYQ